MAARTGANLGLHQDHAARRVERTRGVNSCVDKRSSSCARTGLRAEHRALPRRLGVKGARVATVGETLQAVLRLPLVLALSFALSSVLFLALSSHFGALLSGLDHFRRESVGVVVVIAMSTG